MPLVPHQRRKSGIQRLRLRAITGRSFSTNELRDWPVDGRRRSDHISKDHFFRENVRRATEPRMYANILLSTDGSDLARKGVKHGIALAKALNAKATVITVTEPLEVDYGGGHAGGWVPSQEEFDRFEAACKESAGKVLDEARSMAEQIGIC